MISNIKNYIYTEKEAEESDPINIWTQRGHNQSTREWQTRNIEEEAEKLQQAEKKSNMKPYGNTQANDAARRAQRMAQWRRPMDQNPNVRKKRWKDGKNGKKNVVAMQKQRYN